MNIELFWLFNYSCFRLAICLSPPITAKCICPIVFLMITGVIWKSPCSFIIHTKPNSTSPSFRFRFQWAAYPACLLLTLGVAESLPTNVSHQSDSDRHIKMQIPASQLTAILSHSLSWEAPTREGIRCRGPGVEYSNVLLIAPHRCNHFTSKNPLTVWWMTSFDEQFCFSSKDHVLCLALLIIKHVLCSKTNIANVIILISLDRCISLH